MMIGYMRPFFEAPACEGQADVLGTYETDDLRIEEHGSSKRRIVLDQTMESLAPNDVVLVSHLYVLADSTRHLIEVLDLLEAKQAYLVSIREGIDTRQALNQSFREIVQHLVALQSDVVSMATREGLSKAKELGKQTGRPRKPDENVKRAIEMHQSKQYSLADIREQTWISKSTLYRYFEQ
ncbi:recombinase family protein [Exiguobacterium antarcticum]|uniref:Recombinase family protein n=1 Tax=Exiguobacterium antarcticum TaxID=132920 RepID=A0ABT6R4B1_9BACL|nr:recombinase family protein [Exiguobacterium antarcticum]MDI3235771.1 recombinase family protein [Exiguobacterium antarcticum]